MVENTLHWYLIRGVDDPDRLRARLEARTAHLARLQALQEAGRLKLAGPIPAREGVPIPEGGALGSLIVAAFPSLAEAEAWAADDPYCKAGVYASVLIEPFLPVLP